MSAFLEILVNLKSDIIVTIMLCMILYRVIRSVDKRKVTIVFVKIIVCAIALSVVHSLQVIIDLGYIKASLVNRYIVHGVKSILNAVIIFYWFIYAEYVQDSIKVKYRILLELYAIPIYVLVFLVMISYHTHTIYYFDQSGCYHRGSFFYVLYLIPLLYMVIITIGLTYKMRRKEYYASKKEYLTTLQFLIPIAISIVIQWLLPTETIMGIGFAFAIMLVYLKKQETLISLDQLTGLNNRNYLVKFLAGKIRTRLCEKELYLLMIDANGFKQINDQYGHLEGDVALVRIADSLKKIAEKNHFICRYGGDEFIVVCEVEDEQEVIRFCDRVNDTIEFENRKARSIYPLSVSIGYAKCSSSVMTIPDLIEAADKNLYEVKRGREEVKKVRDLE